MHLRCHKVHPFHMGPHVFVGLGKEVDKHQLRGDTGPEEWAKALVIFFKF